MTHSNLHANALAAIEQPPQMKAGQRVIRMLPDKGCEGRHRRDVVGLQFGEGFGILLCRRRLEYSRRQWLVGTKRLTPPAQNEIADRPPAEIIRPIGHSRADANAGPRDTCWRSPGAPQC